MQNSYTKWTILFLFLIALSIINIFYYWENIWTAWAKYYLRDQDIVVSLTTTPHRINELEFPLMCLAHQNANIRQIYLNIPYKFKRDNLSYTIPEWLENFPNLTILRTNDYGPATKILGSIEKADINNNTIIISVDDDTCYPRNLVLRLAVRAKQNPNMALGVSGAIVDFEKNKESGIVKIMHDNTAVPLLEGFAGIAYRKKFFDDDVFDIQFEPAACIYSDDLYLSYYLANNQVPRRTVNNKYIKTYSINQQDFGYRDDALYKIDTNQAARYKKCLAYLEKKYPKVDFSGNGITP